MIEQYLPWALAVLPGAVVLVGIALLHRPGRKRPTRFSLTFAALGIAAALVIVGLYTAFMYGADAS